MVSWRPEVSFLLGASRPLTRAEGALELWTLGKQGQENRRAGRGWSAATNSRQVARIEGRWRESGRGADETGWGARQLDSPMAGQHEGARRTSCSDPGWARGELELAGRWRSSGRVSATDRISPLALGQV
ncbi:hypothetical protein ASPCADRAFT_212371, partial [Aspergillus carbonarius ITEM 5010]